MGKIKSFIYLDNKKMYSLASQIFEGLVESYVETKKERKDSIEEQKGPIGSGRNLAEIIITEDDKSQNKFLHDYLYNIFEKKLIDLNKVTEFKEGTDAQEIEKLSFIKVKGKAVFNDSKEILRTMNEFNKMGEAISYLCIKDQLDKRFSDEVANIKDRNQKVKANFAKENILSKELRKYAEDNNLYLDEEFLNRLKYIMEYGLNDMLEVQIKTSSGTFSALLDREYLKEEERLLIGKYSRITDVDISIFGYVTQTSNYIPISGNLPTFNDIKSFKELFHGIVNGVIDIENAFIGKSTGETIIDPIAIYVEL